MISAVAPTLRWSPRFADPNVRRHVEEKAARQHDKPKMTIEQMRERLAQYYEAQQLVSDIRGDIEAAREILKQRGTDPDERIVAVKRYTVRCGHLLKQFQSMELHALAKQKLPSLEALSEELSNLTQSMVDFEEYRASQQKRKREKSARHEANRRQRAMETRFAATGSHLPKKKR